MTSSHVMIARALLAIACAATSFAALSSHKVRSLPRAGFDRLLLFSFILSRAAIFGSIFFLLRLQPRGDITIYTEQARWVLAGRVPYRDFPSAYAPLYTYMNAALIRLSSSGLAIMFLAIVCESLTIWLWLKHGREFFSDREVRIAALFYVTSALSVQFVTIDGQNNALAALAVSGAIFLLSRYRAFLSGVCLGLSIVAVKFLPLMYAPLFLMPPNRRWRWAAGIALCCVPIYAAFALNHAPILVPLTSEGALRSSGNLPFLIECALGVALPSRLADGIVALVLTAILALAFRATRHASPEAQLRVLTFAIAALTLALVLFAKKSWPPYLLLCLFPICLSLPFSRIAAASFALFNIIGTIESSLWWLSFHAGTGIEIRQQIGSRPGAAAAFLAVELGLLAGYAWLLTMVIRGITRADGREAVATPPSRAVQGASDQVAF